MASAENMEMEMRDRFSGIRTIVDHEPVSRGFDAQLFGDLRSLQKHVAKDRVIFRPSVGDTRNRFFGHDQGMNGSRRLDVTEGDHQVILVNDIRRNFARGDFLEKRFAHDLSAPPTLARDDANSGTPANIGQSGRSTVHNAGTSASPGPGV